MTTVREASEIPLQRICDFTFKYPVNWLLFVEFWVESPYKRHTSFPNPCRFIQLLGKRQELELCFEVVYRLFNLGCVSGLWRYFKVTFKLVDRFAVLAAFGVD